MNLFKDFEGKLATVVEAGGAYPDGYAALVDRLADYRRIGTPAKDRLLAALLDGTDENIAELRAAAGGEIRAAELATEVRNAGQRRLRELADGIAAENYAAVAKRFDATADKLVSAFQIVDPDTDPAALLGGDAKVGKAWHAAADHAAELDRLTVALRCAAQLAGIPDPRKGLTAAATHEWHDDTIDIGLTLDTEGAHRRKVWVAWTGIDPIHDNYVKGSLGGGRCGRWPAVWRLGVPIRAVDLEQYEAYPLPKAIHSKIVDGRTVQLDPHDYPNDEIPAPEPAKFELPPGVQQRRPRQFTQEEWDSLGEAEQHALLRPRQGVQYPDGTGPALSPAQLQMAAQRRR
ncbi:hypothetical protein ACWDTP_05050 [Mycobacterium sp. NPDC003449]